MPTLDELLKSAGVKDEVISGLPKEVTTALTGFVAEADTKLTAAQQAQADAAEKLRLSKLTEEEVQEYVEKYGVALTEKASVEAQLKATTAYLESLKTQGFDIKIPGVEETPVVPGSPAKGSNAVTFDPEKFAGQVGSTMAAFLDANNEHIRLYGTPIPDSAEIIAQEARSARKPISTFVAEKYKFSEAKQKKQENEFQSRIDAKVKEQVAAKERELAEKYGSNPNLRPGQSSSASLMPKIKTEEFHKSDGNVPRRERLGRMLERVHQDVAAQAS